MNGPGCGALLAGPHEAGTSHQHPEALQTASEGGKGGKGGKGVCELAWYLGCLVDKISAAVQIVDGNIGRMVVRWYNGTVHVLLLQGAFSCRLAMENQRWRSKKEASCVSRPICVLKALKASTPSKASKYSTDVLRTSAV
jgi:hypothetical protein